MGEKSEHQSGRARLEEVSQDEQVRSKDRRYIVDLKNMSLQEIYDFAYQHGFDDGVDFAETPRIAHG
jgi:hypothetical protein